MIEDLNILSVVFTAPVELKGIGMHDKLRLGDDAETGLPRMPGVSARWLAQARAIRVTTLSGETWIPEGNIRSFQPLYESRTAIGNPKRK